jgi:hypothetical protein
MKKLLVNKASASACLAAIALSAFLATPIQAAERPFSFQSVEYMEGDQRQPAAEAFVATHIKPGMALAAAEAVVSKAGAYCHGGRDRNGDVSCSMTFVVANSGDSTQGDVTWLVKLTPDANGDVAQATVRRVTTAF